MACGSASSTGGSGQALPIDRDEYQIGLGCFLDIDGLDVRTQFVGKCLQRLRAAAVGDGCVDAVAGELASDAIRPATLLGLGVGLIAVPHAAPHLKSGALERLLPDWHTDVGPVSLYFTSQKLPAKTRAFVDFVTQAFHEQKLAQVLVVRPRASGKAA